jgi:hypothetical protein
MAKWEPTAAIAKRLVEAPLRKRLLQRYGLHPSDQLFALELGAPSGLPFLDGTIPLAGRSTSPKPQTGNAQQCRRLNALMRHTATSCFPSMRAGERGLLNSGEPGADGRG